MYVYVCVSRFLLEELSRERFERIQLNLELTYFNLEFGNIEKLVIFITIVFYITVYTFSYFIIHIL